MQYFISSKSLRKFYGAKKKTTVRIAEIDNLIQPTDSILSKSCLTELSSLWIIYNYKSIIQNNGIGIEKKELDNVRLQRRERVQKENNPSNIEEQQQNAQQKKKQDHNFKNYLCKLIFDEPNQFKIVQQSIETIPINNVKLLNPIEFGNKRPSPSIVQEKTTGRFYIYDNSCGKVHIFSSDIMQNETKDKPLVSLLLKEDPPRQDPLLYLMECEHEEQWKCILFVIGGHQKYKGVRYRPFRSIKVFEIKKREVSLTPVITIMMQYPRDHPIVFMLSKEKGVHWKDTMMQKSQYGKKQPLESFEKKMLFILGGNQLQDFANEENLDLMENVKNANHTCEYIELKKVLDHVNRAQEVFQLERFIYQDEQFRG